MAESGWSARPVVAGLAEGPALISATPLSFLGDLDIRSGRVVGRSSDLFDQTVGGTVLILPETRGSAGAWRFLYQLKVHETHPVALILRDMPDPSVTQGAVLAKIPIVTAPEAGFWFAVTPELRLRVDGTTGQISLA